MLQDTILQATPVHFWLFAGAVWLACLGSLYVAWRFLKRLQLVEDTPQSLIRSASQGYVELQGEARLMPGEPILAPLSRMRCVWWRYRVEQYVRAGRSSGWRTVQSGTSPDLFLLADAQRKFVQHDRIAACHRDIFHFNK